MSDVKAAIGNKFSILGGSPFFSHVPVVLLDKPAVIPTLLIRYDFRQVL
jgi:hypothetical protein